MAATKTQFALKFFTALSILLHSGFLSNLRLPCNFSLYWNIFIIQDFWATCACPKKQSLPWNFSLRWVYFYIQDFWATCACLENRVCPEFTVLDIYFLSFRNFEQLALDLKTEIALKFFKTRVQPTPRLVRLWAYAILKSYGNAFASLKYE